MTNRKEMQIALSRVLDASEVLGLDYAVAFGFFSYVDFELILDRTYKAPEIEHALRYGVDHARQCISEIG